MDTPNLEQIQAAYDAITDADADAERIRRKARIHFGKLVNQAVEAKTVQQETVAEKVGKTREWVRRLQVTARQTEE